MLQCQGVIWTKCAICACSSIAPATEVNTVVQRQKLDVSHCLWRQLSCWNHLTLQWAPHLPVGACQTILINYIIMHSYCYCNTKSKNYTRYSENVLTVHKGRYNWTNRMSMIWKCAILKNEKHIKNFNDLTSRQVDDGGWLGEKWILSLVSILWPQNLKAKIWLAPWAKL